jgi:hypothetical protein
MKKLFVFILIICFACTKPLPQLENMDMARWRKDKNGCNGDRANMLSPLIEQKDELKGLSEDGIQKLLGKPDQNELYKRNQKFFYYFLEPSLKCDPTKTKARRLSIRFNAMELAKEVVID